MRPPKGGKVEEQKDRYENEPESEDEDVEGHRFRSGDDPEKQAPGKQAPGLLEDEDVEAHQFAPGQQSPGQQSPGQQSPGQQSPGAADL
jgi:trimeric autotransporter adhesin